MPPCFWSSCIPCWQTGESAVWTQTPRTEVKFTGRGEAVTWPQLLWDDEEYESELLKFLMRWLVQTSCLACKIRPRENKSRKKEKVCLRWRPLELKGIPNLARSFTNNKIVSLKWIKPWSCKVKPLIHLTQECMPQVVAMPCFWSSFLYAWKEAVEAGSSTWAPVTHMADFLNW